MTAADREQQILTANALHQQGWTVYRIATQNYREWGYRSHKTLSNMLYIEFRRRNITSDTATPLPRTRRQAPTRPADPGMLDVFAALATLTDWEREVWVDTTLLGLTGQEIADRNGVSAKAVWCAKQRADRVLNAPTSATRTRLCRRGMHEMTPDNVKHGRSSNGRSYKTCLRCHLDSSNESKRRARERRRENVAA